MTSIAPAKVLVAVVVPVKYAPTISPTTESFAYGLVVPMPTRLLVASIFRVSTSNTALPTTSNMLPVEVVALLPTTTT